MNFYFINRNGLSSSNGSLLQDTLKKKFINSNKLRTWGATKTKINLKINIKAENYKAEAELQT